MSLSDLDRPITTWRYDRWDREVQLRPITAHQLAELNLDFAHVNGQDSNSLEAVQFYCELLAAALINPSYTADEWAHEASIDTVLELGQKALEVCGLAEAKKN